MHNDEKCAVCRRQRGQRGVPGRPTWATLKASVQPSTGCLVEQRWGLTEESLVLGLRVERVLCLFQYWWWGQWECPWSHFRHSIDISATVRSHLSMFLKILHLSFSRVSWKASAAWWLSSTAVSLYSTASSFPELQRNELVRPG